MRRRRRADLFLALLIALTGAVVLTAAAGARRTDTAFDRFLDWSNVADVQLQYGTDDDIDDDVLAAFREHPDVIEAAQLQFTQGFAEGSELDLMVVSGPDPALFSERLDRPRLLEGRRADPSSPHEVLLSRFLQQDLGVEVGDTVTLQTFTADTDFEEPSTVELGPAVELEVVGIATLPYDAADASFAFGMATPAFYERYARTTYGFGPLVDVRVRDGADATAVAEEVVEPFAVDELFLSPAGDLAATVEDATRALVVGLWAFTAVAAAAFLVAGGQAIRRRIASADADQPALRAVGLSRGQRALAAAASVAPTIGIGVVAAGLISIPASATMPIGAPGRAEPEPGIRVDPLLLIAGAVLLAVLLLGSTMWAASRQTSLREAGVSSTSGSAARATPVQLLRGALPPPESVGVTMALDAGAPQRRTPVWSAFLGAIVGSAGLVGVLTFGAGLDGLVEEPARSGWNWTLRVDPSEDELEAVASLPDVESVGQLYQRFVVVEGEQVPGNAISSVKGVPSFSLVDGRMPLADDEVALGPELIDALSIAVGDQVEMTDARGRDVSKVVVGKALFPTFDEDVAFNTGAALTVTALEELKVSDGEGPTSLVTFDEGVSEEAAAERISSVAPEAVSAYSYSSLPTDVANLDDVRPLPRALAAFLGFLALAAVGHTLATSVLRRRRELGTVRSLGFVAADVRRVVTAQSTTMVVVGLLLGVPLGVVIGRTVWRAVADGLGVVSTPVVPIGLLSVVVPAVMLAAVLVAWYPARMARRGVALDALRAE